MKTDFGIVAALSIEIGPLLDRMKGLVKISGVRHSIYEGEIEGHRIAVSVAGAGEAMARKATRLLIDGHRPDWVISAGFGGGLDLSLKRLDLVVIEEVIRETSGIRCSLSTGSWAQNDKRGRLLTVDRIIRTASEKAELRRKFQADVVDMETFAVAEICAERSTKMLGLRIVTDEASFDLPPEVHSILGSSGAYRVGAALGSILRRPSSVKDLWNLREIALQASDLLALRLVRWFGEIRGS